MVCVVLDGSRLQRAKRLKKEYFFAENTDKMQRLAARSGKAATRLINYLRSCRPRSQRAPRTLEPLEPSENLSNL
jgi:hypothetical protein